MPAASDGLACKVKWKCTQASVTTGGAVIRPSLHSRLTAYAVAPRKRPCSVVPANALQLVMGYHDFTFAQLDPIAGSEVPRFCRPLITSSVDTPVLFSLPWDPGEIPPQGCPF